MFLKIKSYVLVCSNFDSVYLNLAFKYFHHSLVFSNFALSDKYYALSSFQTMSLAPRNLTTSTIQANESPVMQSDSIQTATWSLYP